MYKKHKKIPDPPVTPILSYDDSLDFWEETEKRRQFEQYKKLARTPHNIHFDNPYEEPTESDFPICGNIHFD